MSIAETLLLVNDNVQKPLNKQIEELKQFLIDSTLYVASDNLYYFLGTKEFSAQNFEETAFSFTFSAKGSIKLKGSYVFSYTMSGGYISIEINGIEKFKYNHVNNDVYSIDEIISFNAGDTITIKVNGYTTGTLTSLFLRDFAIYADIINYNMITINEV